MPNYRRAYQPGGLFFLTVVTYDRAPIFQSDIARQLLHESIVLTRRERPFEFRAMVLLPNHFHFLIALPENDSNFSGRVAAIKGRFTRRWLEQGGNEQPQPHSRTRQQYRGVWQKRFWEHTVRDQDDVNRCIEYMMFNPVKHGLATCPHQWPYSSFSQLVKRGVFTIDWQCVCNGNPSTFNVEIAGSEVD